MISRSVVAALVLMVAAPCAQAQTEAAPADSAAPETLPPAAPPSEPFTRETPIEKIAADPQGAAVLNKDIPGLLTDKSYDFFKSMNLRQIQRLSDGDLSDDMVQQAEADLKALPGH